MARCSLALLSAAVLVLLIQGSASRLRSRSKRALGISLNIDVNSPVVALAANVAVDAINVQVKAEGLVAELQATTGVQVQVGLIGVNLDIQIEVAVHDQEDVTTIEKCQVKAGVSLTLQLNALTDVSCTGRLANVSVNVQVG